MSELPPHKVPPAQLLLRMADEMQRCLAILTRVEQSCHQIVEDQPDASLPKVWRANLQDIDLLEQVLGDLALCLSGLAAEPQILGAAEISPLRILAATRLDDLRRRLTGRPDNGTSSQRIELF